MSIQEDGTRFGLARPSLSLAPCRNASTMTGAAGSAQFHDGSTTGPRWGISDPHSTRVALGITIPLAIVACFTIMFIGWLNAPGERKEFSFRGTARPLWNSRPAARFQTEPSADGTGTQ